MPDYTNPWTDGHPPGSGLARDIDAFIQRVRLDIHERMNDVVVDWSADPVIPKGAGVLAKTKLAAYNTGAPAGSRVSGYVDYRAMLILTFAGVTNGAGQVTIDLDEVNAASGGVDNWRAQAANGSGFVSWSGFRATDGVPVHMRVVGSSGADNTLTLAFKFGNGANVANTTVAGTFIFMHVDDPTV